MIINHKKRIYCLHCHYPEVTCVCDAISIIDLPIKVIVLQHKKESLHAKNTIKLACLVSPTIKVISTATPKLIDQAIVDADSDHTLVVYPSPKSKPIENIQSKQNGKNNIKTIILLDGSWKQAYSIWQSFSSLHSFEHVHFTSPPQRQYDIRKSKQIFHLSSIEALSYAVSTLCDIDTRAYSSALLKMQSFWPQNIH
jgi:DTW domain-containing protein YfiP